MLSTLVVLLTLSQTAAPSCSSTGLAVEVDAAGHRLHLCAHGSAHQSYPVAIGSGGIAGKRVKWAQTPLGHFELLEARPSQYHLFIPLKNPDARRFTAWAIGIHGPPRANKDDGASNVSTDWTLGCIAVATDADIEAIATWARDNKVTRVVFR